MQRLLCLLACVVVLAACSNSSTTTSTAAQNQTPESVNAAWIEAMKANNRDTAIELVGNIGTEEQQIMFADAMLRRMRGMLDPAQDPGGLVSIQQFAPVVDGGDRLGLSLWTFAKTKRCYQARLATENDQWKVINWNERPSCPTA